MKCTVQRRIDVHIDEFPIFVDVSQYRMLIAMVSNFQTFMKQMKDKKNEETAEKTSSEDSQLAKASQEVKNDNALPENGAAASSQTQAGWFSWASRAAYQMFIEDE